MGLSMVQGFATQSGGAVEIASFRGQGTTVTLWLPPAGGRSTARASVEPVEFVIGQRPARILVCDDDSDVCSLVGSVLRDLGHTIWEANNPNIALQILEKTAANHVLLVDYAMPEMNGRSVIDRARARQPGIKALLITGYPEALCTDENFEIPVLPKPFKPAELSRRVAEIVYGLSSGESADGPNVQH